MDDTTILRTQLHETKSRLETATTALNDNKVAIDTFQQEAADLRQQTAHSAEQISRLSADLVAKDLDLSRVGEELEQTRATLQLETQSSQSLTLELNEKTRVLEGLRDELSHRTERVDELTSRVSHLNDDVYRLDGELAVSRLNVDSMTASRDAQVSALKAELDLSSEAKARADTEVAELTARLASLPSNDRSLDSEPADPEPSEEDMQSPRDSRTLTEVQELKTQLAELQELLAQKVLLINELKGD